MISGKYYFRKPHPWHQFVRKYIKKIRRERPSLSPGRVTIEGVKEAAKHYKKRGPSLMRKKEALERYRAKWVQYNWEGKGKRRKYLRTKPLKKEIEKIESPENPEKIEKALPSFQDLT